MNKPARDLVGYGRQRPTGRWPNGSKLAVNVVVNYEEGSERSFAMDDPDQGKRDADPLLPLLS